MPRLRAWWQLALAGAASLTAPPADQVRADRDFDQLLRASVLYRSLHAGFDMARRAWSHALVGILAARIVAAWRPLPAAERLRSGSIAIAFAGATAGGLQLVGGREPFVWILPLSIAIFGVVGVVAARLAARS